MSNSFPSMISNEPPPLDQSDEEDEDSEEFRDFSSGLKLDIDPSPMSTPQKAKVGNLSPPPPSATTITVHSPQITTTPAVTNGTLSPEVTESSSKEEDKDEFKACNNHDVVDNSHVNNNIMKTSYIGTLSESDSETKFEVEEEEEGEKMQVDSQNLQQQQQEQENVVEEFGQFSESLSTSQAQCSSPSNFHSLTPDNEGEDEEDIDAFQDFQTTVTISDIPNQNNETTITTTNTRNNEEEADKSDDENLQNIPTTNDDNINISENLPPLDTPADELNFEDALSLDFNLDNEKSNSSSSPTDIFEPVSDNIPTLPVEKSPVEENTFQADFEDFQSATVTTTSPTVDEDEDEFDNFQAFESAPSLPNPIVSVPSLSSACSTTTSNNNFVNNVTPTVIPPPHSSTSQSINVEEMPSSSSSFPKSTSSLLLESKFESIVKSLFVINSGSGTDDSEISSSLKPIDKELKEDNDNAEWNHVEDFEGSQGLIFKWLNSVAYEKMLRSLKIDKSSIMYSNKWGAIEVPRFAASLVNSPLLPESTSVTPGSTTFKSGDFVSPSTVHQTVKSDAMSPSSENDCGRGQGCTNQLSQEAEQILSQLPDLSFMRAKTLVFPNNVLEAQSVNRTRDVI